MASRILTLLILPCLVAALVAPRALGAEDEKPAEAPKLTLAEFERRKAEPGTVVVDVRSAEEFAKGHIPGAVNIPVQAGDFDEQVAKLDKEKTYLVHCAVGVRSERACKKMSGVVTKLFNFPGGMIEWKKAGKPVEGAGEKAKGGQAERK